MNFRRDMRATMAEKSAFAISIVTSVAVNIHERFSKPSAPMLSRIGRMT